MKTRRKQLELRPIVPGFLKIIPRLPAMVFKKDVLYKIFTPVTCIFRGIRHMFKRKPSLRKIKHAAEEMKNQCLDSQKRNDCPPTLKLHSPQVIQERKIVAEIFNWQGSRQKTCLSCQEDRPAYNTCRMCLKLHSTLPPSSCRKCQQEKPLVNLCMKYHQNQPVIYIRNQEQNVAIYKNFIQDMRKHKKRQMSTGCNGRTHMINNCPMCLSFWPTVGECTCLQCKSTQPVVKVFSADSHKRMMIDVCPCVTCYKTHPRIRICSTCKSRKLAKLKEDTSFYVLLP